MFSYLIKNNVLRFFLKKVFKSLVLVSIIGASDSGIAISETSKQSKTDQALKRASTPASLAFLENLKLPPKLDAAIAHDISTLSTGEARQSIVNRLQLDLIANGTIDPILAAQSTAPVQAAAPPRVTLDAETSRTWQRALGVVSRSFSFKQDHVNLQDALSAESVIRTSSALYGRQAEFLQVDPGTPIEVAEAKPSTETSSTSEAKATIGASASQTQPGTQVELLKDCDRSFDEIKNSCGPLKNGMRCETFSRKAFPEVARITTPEGGTCSGTVISENWVLSAAHCFLSERSSKEYSANYASRKTVSGDALMRDGDLHLSQLHLDHIGSSDSRRQIDYVIVNGDWDPKKVIKVGQPITVGTTTRTADVIYPGDLALIHISANDALISNVKPAKIPDTQWAGEITTAGYGVTTVGAGNPGELWVTWPEPKVSNNEGQLELKFSSNPSSSGKPASTKLISTFCLGDSGGPAFAGRHRGCQTSDVFERPRTVVGVTSYYWGYLGKAANSSAEAAGFCQAAPVMRFVNLAAPANRKWICDTSKQEAKGC